MPVDGPLDDSRDVAYVSLRGEDRVRPLLKYDPHVVVRPVLDDPVVDDDVSRFRLDTLCAPVVFYPQVLKNVRVKSKPDAQNDPDVQAAVKAVADELGDTGRILVRESGTEPVIRVMVEAATRELCEKYVDSVIAVIKDKGHLV